MIYLDHAATSPLLPEVLDAMAPWFGVPANPSSVHAPGRRAAAALHRARIAVAALLDRDPAGIVFTSGATEANHTALRGIGARGARAIAASPIEHPSVHGAIAASGAAWVPLAVGADGVIDLSLPGEVPVDAIVCMAVNHELGTVQPVDRAAQIAAERGVWLHVDAVQAAGKVAVEGLARADSVAVSAHKLGGPVGVGALSLRDGSAFPALLTGGAQERGRRAGTVNVAGAVGFGAACTAAADAATERRVRWTGLAETLRAGLVACEARPAGDWAKAVPSTTCCVVPGVRGDTLVQALDLEGIAVSSGAACASGSVEPSPVLRAIADPEPAGGLRIAFGPATSMADVEAFLRAFAVIAPRAREAARFE